MTIDQVFKDIDMPMSQSLKDKFTACNIKPDNNKSFNNLVRMVSGSHKQRAVAMLEEKIFRDENAGEFLLCAMLSCLENYKAL